MIKEVIDLKMIGTPEFRRKQVQKEKDAKAKEEFVESRTAKSVYEGTISVSECNLKMSINDLTIFFSFK